jgi:hypothetical protein
MVTMTLTTDSIQATAHAIDYTADNETWIIDPGVLAYSQDLVGVDSHGFFNSTLINFGQVYATDPTETGVYFDEDIGNASVTNKVGAEIFGSLRGVYLDGHGSNLVNNFGTIIGASTAGDDVFKNPEGLSIGVEFGGDTVGVHLNNHGSIIGAVFGAYIASPHAEGTIDNFKTIRAGVHGTGLFLATGAGQAAHVTNHSGGVIAGGFRSFFEEFGQVVLTNFGTMKGEVLTESHAVIINQGAIKGEVALHLGNDAFNGTGGTSGPIFTFSGNDHIIAGKGEVQVHVEVSGSDTLTSGPGHDQFFFEFAPTGEVEKITNFKPALDKIVLSESAGFMGLGVPGTLAAARFHVGHPVNANAQIDYTPGNGFLFYDANGNAGPHIHFATLATHPTLTHAAFVVEA